MKKTPIIVRGALHYVKRCRDKMIMEVGRVCRIVKGKDAGKYCVVVDRADKNFVIVDGKGMKKSKMNVLHLEPLPKVVELKKGAANSDVVAALEAEKLV